MNTSEEFHIRLSEGASFGAGSWHTPREYHNCKIVGVDLTLNNLKIDFASISSLDSSYIRLNTGSSIPTKDAMGTLSFTTPGVAGTIDVPLSGLHEVTEERESAPASSGCASVILIAVATLSLAAALWS